MLSATDVFGNPSTSGLADADHPLGPYLKAMPTQPFTGISMCKVRHGTDMPALYPGVGMGWLYQPETGRFFVDGTDYATW